VFYQLVFFVVVGQVIDYDDNDDDYEQLLNIESQ